MRRFIPRALRRRAAGPIGRLHGARIRHRLAALAASGRPILAGPWLGEVGFELLYWAPFVRWFASEFGVAPGRLTVLSRGGTASWYGEAAGRYLDAFDYVTPDLFRQWHEDRVGEHGEQKQTRMTVHEGQLLDRVLPTARAETGIVHPSLMYELMNPFWWGHLDERWIHRHTKYQPLERPPQVAGLTLPARYVATKFYFNDCFPATDRNRAFVRDVLERLMRDSPVVSLATGVAVDDHGTSAATAHGVLDVGTASAAQNLHVQTAIVAHADAFVGTYGGFAYLAPFLGVRCAAYYDDPAGFSRSHLRMAQSALALLGTPDLLDTRQTSGAEAQ